MTSRLDIRARLGTIRASSLWVFALVLVALAVGAAPASAAVNKQVNFQGRLADPSGIAVPDGTYNLEFKLHDNATTTGDVQGACTGSCLWREPRTLTNKVTVTRGLFSVQLGSVTSLASFNFDQDPLFLSVRVGGTSDTPTWDAEMTPRHRLAAAPHAIHAADSSLLGGEAGSYYTNAANLTGTIADARLSTNIAVKNANNNFSTSQTITGTLTATDMTCTDCLNATDMAPNSVGSSELIDGSITGTDILDGSVASADIALDTIVADDIAAGGVASSEILDNSIQSWDIADGSVSTADVQADLGWGNGGTRTLTRDDAGTLGGKSGYFETSAPTNYYTGASSWQHLIEARHSNSSNNYAMQIAGSFFDQNFYGRKTNNSGTTSWRRFLMEGDGVAPSGSAGGDLTGTYPNPTIGANAVGSSEITDGQITSADIADGNVSIADLSFDPATQTELNALGVAGTINTASNPVDWTKLKSVPAGFADGVDNSGGTPSGTAGGDLTGTYPNPTLVEEPVRTVGAAGQPAFNAGWGNYGSGYAPVAFYMDATGIVHLEGTANYGGGGVIFTLPLGYRPTRGNLTFGLVGGDPFATSRVDVRTDGSVAYVLGGSSASYTPLDNISFRP